jgi:hypothetical protein
MNPYSANLFRLKYIQYSVLIEAVSELHSAGALVAISESVFGVERTHDLECFEEYVWLEITVTDGRNCLFGSHFSHDVKVHTIQNFQLFRNCIGYLKLRREKSSSDEEASLKI